MTKLRNITLLSLLVVIGRGSKHPTWNVVSIDDGDTITTLDANN